MPARGRSGAWLLVAGGLMLLALVLAHLGGQVRPRQLLAPLASLPVALGPWRGVGPDLPLDQASLDLLKPQDYLLRNYIDGQGRVCALFVAYFGLQVEGAIIHSPRHCLPGAGWRIMSRDLVEIATPRGPRPVNHLIIGQALERMSVLYWYQGRGRVEANEYLDRLQLVLDGLAHQRTDGALVRLTSPLPPGDAHLLNAQLQMAAALVPALERLLPAMEP
jgi:EpsI family protein